VHKSSVHALFGSKQELQLATLAAARTILIDQVIVPRLSSEVGIARLRRIAEATDSWSENHIGATANRTGVADSPQPRDAHLARQRRHDHLVDEDRAGGGERGELQLLLGSEQSMHAALVHAELRCESADREAFKALARGHLHGRSRTAVRLRIPRARRPSLGSRFAAASTSASSGAVAISGPLRSRCSTLVWHNRVILDS